MVSKKAQCLRVLIVEDDPEARALLSLEIADCGYQATDVADAQQAMDTMTSERHDIVVTDIRLPGMDGVALTRWIKELSPNTEIILVTGHATIETAAAALRLGACDYLLKPMTDLRELRDSLARAADRIQQRAQSAPSESERIFDRTQLIELLDLLPLAVLILDHDFKVRGQNRFGRLILQRQAGLHIGSDQRLTATNARCARELASLLDIAHQTPAGDASQVVGGMRLKSAGRSSMPLMVVKMSHGKLPPREQGGTIMVTMPAPESDQSGTMRLLIDLYGLTPTEAKVAAHTLRGCSLEQAARDLGIAETTARTHLRHIFSKTNTSRQGELVSALLHGPAMLRPLQGLQ